MLNNNDEASQYSWGKYGLIIKPDSRIWWMKTHAMIPSIEDLGGGWVKVYFSGRNDYNQSHIGWAVIDLTDPTKVQEMSSEPVLKPGSLGCFDDNGVTPSCIIKTENEIRLYYIGWNPGSTVRMHLFGGLAISHDGGRTFERWSQAPIIERNKVDPFLNTAPWVIRTEDDWRMYYVSGVEWVHQDLPRYNIKMARSEDGLLWQRDGHICIDFKDSSENALARPFVIKDGKIWKMWFAHKGETYRLGYAESIDGIDWCRMDQKIGIDVSDAGFDSEMIEYAAIIKHKDQSFMFYNGNNYGFDGIGLAVSQ
jgi:predicted GH43/DUF377 family glycosyl hydrolase